MEKKNCPRVKITVERHLNAGLVLLKRMISMYLLMEYYESRIGTLIGIGATSNGSTYFCV